MPTDTARIRSLREAAEWCEREHSYAVCECDMEDCGRRLDAVRYALAAEALREKAARLESDPVAAEIAACAALCDKVASESEAALNASGPWPKSEELVLKEAMTTARQLARAIRARGGK